MPENWDRVKELLALVLERESGDREDFLRQACEGDDFLRSEIESLLSSFDGASTFLEDCPAADLLSAQPRTMAGKRIGAYRIIREIGHGGMAVVYLGERDDQNFRKRVAIKMVKPGIGTEQVLQRFRNERQTLAALEHTNIVKLLDGGNTPDGLPYFVMEYVEGTPIDEYCDAGRLSIADRLQLFRTVCSTVQYAHQSLVIHRDLKPANILITNEGVPRLLDFGIAKLLSPECQQTRLVTRADSRLMTPEYASPEQVRGEPITSATDIYSLGVLLYELLTGSRPYNAANGSWSEIERSICETEPPRPSTKTSRDRERLRTNAEKRSAEPKQLVRILRGDLDSITMKALEKDPGRRYTSASELSADAGKYLAHEPVSVRPPSATYRAGKYVRRHPVGVAVAAGIVLLLAGFAVTQSVQLRRITRERDRANRVTEFMEGMFKTSDPREARGNSITAREVLDKASKGIDRGLTKDPQLQAQMMQVMGDVYRNLGLLEPAQKLFERSGEIRLRVLGPENANTLRSQDDLAWILTQRGQFDAAEKLGRETFATRVRVFGRENLDTLKSMSNLGWTLDREGHYAEAEKLDREVLDTRRRLGKTEDRETAAIMNNLAATVGHEGHYADAEKLKRETLDLRRRILGPEDPDTLTAMNNLAFTLQQEGHFGEAEKLQRDTLDMQRRILGPEHPDTLRSINNLAKVLFHEGHLPESEQLQRTALDTKRRILGPEHQDTLWAMQDLAQTLQGEGQYSEAEKLQRQTLEIQRRVLGPNRPNTLGTMSNLADTLGKEGHYTEAERLLRETLDEMLRVLGPEHPDTLITTAGLAEALEKEGRYDEAEKLARQTLEAQRRLLGLEHPDTTDTEYDLACILAHRGQSDEAFSVLREAIDHGLDPATDAAIATDPNLRVLRRDPRFEELASYARRRASGHYQKP
jgi:eukaryotic-like serine/threonine-protein kinase